MAAATAMPTCSRSASAPSGSHPGRGARRFQRRSRGPVEHETSTRTSLVTSLPLAMAQAPGIPRGAALGPVSVFSITIALKAATRTSRRQIRRSPSSVLGRPSSALRGRSREPHNRLLHDRQIDRGRQEAEEDREPREPDMWERAKTIAAEMLDGKLWLPEVGKATHYHAYWVRPGCSPPAAFLVWIKILAPQRPASPS